MELNEFKAKVLKLRGPKIHKITNSLGAYDAYKWIRKHQWLNIGRPLKEHEFYSIIRGVNNNLVEVLLSGNDITLPCRMGSIELRKYKSKIAFKNGKLVTNLPIDWDRTIKLWSEDEEAYKERTLVKREEKELFKIFYNKRAAIYKNTCFMQFSSNRTLKKKLKQKIKDGAIDAFKVNE